MNEPAQEFIPSAESLAPAVTTEIAAYSPLASNIALMLAKHKGVVHDVTTTKGIEAARKDRAELRTLRVNLEDARKREKAASLEYGKKVDAEAKRLTAIIEPLEEGYDSAIKAEEARKVREKEERDAKERERVAGIRRAIDGLKSYATAALKQPSGEIRAILEQMTKDDPSNPAYVELYAELLNEAKGAYAATREFVEELLQKRVAEEDDAARLAAERAELDRQRAELQAEQTRLDNERKEREDRERQAREARDAEERAAKAAKDAEDQRLRDIEDARLKQERDELAATKAAQDAEAKRLKDQKDEQDREAARLKTERDNEERDRKAREEMERVAGERRAAREAREKLEAAADPWGVLDDINRALANVDMDNATLRVYIATRINEVRLARLALEQAA